MKPANKKTLWKRATSEKHPGTEFDSVVRTLSDYIDTSLQGNLNELLSNLQQLGSEKTGKTKELFNAVQNVLENMRLELVESNSGVATVLRDVASFLVESKTATVLEGESTRLDELLERLDFVASGGTDDEVPRVQEKGVVPEPVSYVPTFPIKLPKHFEDPSVLHFADRLKSLSVILSAHALGANESNPKKKLELEQLVLANYCLNTAKHNTKTDLKAFATKLTKDISDSLSKNTSKAVDFVKYEVSDGCMYRSLSEVLRWKLRDLAVTIGSELTSRADAEILLEISCRESYISAMVNFIGLRTAFDLISLRMDELSLELDDFSISEQDESSEKTLSSSAKTRKERIAHSLVKFGQFVDCAHGRFGIESDDSDRFTVTVNLPSEARALHTFPIVIGSDLFLLESHFLTAVFGSTEVHWNESQTCIEHKAQSFRYCCIDEEVKPKRDAPTWILLLDTKEHKLALEVESIQEPEFQISVPSVSEIHHGHKCFGERKLKLLLDPSELRPSRNNSNHSDSVNVNNSHFLCLNVSHSLEDKIRRCIDSDKLLMRHTKTVAETLSQLQEYRPDYLIIEDQLDEFRAVDALARIAHATPLLKVRVLIFADDRAQPLEQMKNDSFELTSFARDVDFGKLKKVLAVI
ncbi:MAG: hypothetical protein F4227_10545 [Gammaproteobacteria bacterium]|nr:hypothetical protein [Gammaproteobacteria bacterium]MYF03377.1 hypothetical protein [Gammaproteobacteria bacterium]